MKRLLVIGFVLGLSALSVQTQNSTDDTYNTFNPKKWEAALTRAWNDLSPKARQELIENQRDWIKRKNALTGFDLERMLVNRTTFLMAYKIDPAAALDVFRMQSRELAEFEHAS